MFLFFLILQFGELYANHADVNIMTDIVEGPFVLNCTVPICTGPMADIYCHGEIIGAAAQFGLDKICPGPQLTYDVPVVLENFRKLRYPIKKDDFIAFCRENFRNATYLEAVEPVDWKKVPEYFKLIKDPKHRRLADFINLRWKNLTRRFAEDVFKHPNLYPIVSVQKPFVVPGGFFQSYYYWDSFWINKGLLVSDMFATVKGTLDNFADIINELGYVPNGGYLYHQQRTQPPLFVRMVEDYYMATKDVKSVSEWMPAMDKEMAFFTQNRTISDGRFAGMYVYKANSNCPRPENYLSDIRLAQTSDDPMFTWRGMATACESGWDFSSRWFAHEGPQAYQKRTIRTHKIVPVDLNVYMAINLYVMSQFKELVQDHNNAVRYHSLAASVEQKLHDHCWNEENGAWFDIDIETEQQRVAFYPSNIYPLLLKNSSLAKTRRVLQYLNKTNVLNYPGGIPSTDPVKSTEQWDFPNVWAPLEHQFIRSMWASGDKDLIKLGNAQAELFVYEVYNGLFEAPDGKGGLWEKYDARTKSGHPGEGGEYTVQEGFGWTNGAALDLIVHLALHAHSSVRSLTPPADMDSSDFFGGSPHFYILLVIVALLLAILLLFLIRGIKSKMRSRYNSRTEAEEPLMCESE